MPKLGRMSLRTIPLWSSTFGPFDPSPGYGPAVSSGISPVDVDDDARTVVLHRGGLRVLVNLGDDPVTFDLGLPVGRVLLASEPVEIEDEALTVGPESFAIAELD